MKALLVFGASVCLSVASAAIAQQPTSLPSTIRVTGNAVVSTKPDRVEVDLGVEAQATQAQAAATENATKLDAVLGALRKTLGAGADVRTFNYALTPNYRNQPGASQPAITGYTATNLVRINMSDLSKVGAVIDTATHAGANRVEGIRFTLRDSQAAHLQALREAAARARSEADTLASALGVKVLRVLTVEDVGSNPPPMRPLPLGVARAEMSRAPTPIEAGNLDVSAEVTLTVEVGS